MFILGHLENVGRAQDTEKRGWVRNERYESHVSKGKRQITLS